MRTIRTGQMAYDPSIAGARLAALATPTTPQAYAYAGGRMIYDRPEVKVSRICMRERRFRYAKVTFNYNV